MTKYSFQNAVRPWATRCVCISLTLAGMQLQMPAFAAAVAPPPTTPAPTQQVTTVQSTVPVARTNTDTPNINNLQLNLPYNPLLTPADQTYGNSSISLTRRIGKERLENPASPVKLPKFYENLASNTVLKLAVEDIPANATVIDTEEEAGAERFVPIAFVESTEAQVPLFGNVSSDGPLVVRVNDKHSGFAVFTDEGRLLNGNITGSKDGIIAGAPGTVLSTDNGVLTMHAGKAIVASGLGTVRIATRVMGIKIEPKTTVLIEYKTDKVAMIAVLSAPSGGSVKVRSAFAPESVFELASGDEAIASDRALGTVPDAESLAKNHLLKLKPQVSDLRSNLQELASPEKIGKKASATLLSANPEIIEKAETINQTQEKQVIPALRLFASPGTAFSASKAGDIHVYFGHVFLRLPENMTVSTNLGEIACEAGSTLNIAREPGLARVQLFDTPKSARVICSKKQIVLDKGQEVLISDHYPSQSEAVPHDGIGRRQFKLHELGNNMTAVLNDFYVFSCIKNADNLKLMTKSKTDADRQMLGSLLKFCAALQIASADRGQFYFPPDQTASNSHAQ